MQNYNKADGYFEALNHISMKIAWDVGEFFFKFFLKT